MTHPRNPRIISHAVNLVCPHCSSPHRFATGSATPEAGDLVICAECYAVSQIRNPGPNLYRIDEAALSPEMRTQVEQHRALLKRFKEAASMSMVTKP